MRLSGFLQIGITFPMALANELNACSISPETPVQPMLFARHAWKDTLRVMAESRDKSDPTLYEDIEGAHLYEQPSVSEHLLAVVGKNERATNHRKAQDHGDPKGNVLPAWCQPRLHHPHNRTLH